jgi:hypothetical protein
MLARFHLPHGLCSMSCSTSMATIQWVFWPFTCVVYYILDTQHVFLISLTLPHRASAHCRNDRCDGYRSGFSTDILFSRIIPFRALVILCSFHLPLLEKENKTVDSLRICATISTLNLRLPDDHLPEIEVWPSALRPRGSVLTKKRNVLGR